MGTTTTDKRTNTTGGRGNHAFADGHVEPIAADEIVNNNVAYGDLLKK